MLSFAWISLCTIALGIPISLFCNVTTDNVPALGNETVFFFSAFYNIISSVVLDFRIGAINLIMETRRTIPSLENHPPFTLKNALAASSLPKEDTLAKYVF
ncbi:unnamed protein product [Citrullus colocynthis]|uniref:Uncharacterized protein n=1 Tax=Citrullus colocynthis TaxID=252529 RepID=A0ABP0YIF4_9ROSI